MTGAQVKQGVKGALTDERTATESFNDSLDFQRARHSTLVVAVLGTPMFSKSSPSRGITLYIGMPCWRGRGGR